MTLSRKAFLTRGLFNYGLELVREVRGEPHRPELLSAVETFGPLLVDNRHCLAQRGGCFTCIDHCPHGAISIRLGVGIGIDVEKCAACGECVARCPVEPKVIVMNPETQLSTTATRKENDI